MSIPQAKLKQINSCFDRLHTTLGCLCEHVEAINDDKATALYTEIEHGLLAPMRRLRKHLDIPYVWNEQPEVSDDGPGEENSDRELLCAEGS